MYSSSDQGKGPHGCCRRTQDLFGRTYTSVHAYEVVADSHLLQLAFGEVKSEDKAELAKLISAIQANCASPSLPRRALTDLAACTDTDKHGDTRNEWGGSQRGHKSASPPSSFLSTTH